MSAANNDLNLKLLVFVISLGPFMGSLDITIVNIALPSMARHFMVSTSMVSWVALSYLLVMTGFLLAFGRLGDIKGHKKIFITGFFVFTAGSLLCGLVPYILDSIGMLILFRIVQAVGAAMMGALASGMIATYLPETSRGKALGFITVMASIGIALGPFLGGFLTQYLGWHWIFLVNVPVGIFAVIIGIRCIPADSVTEKNEMFDFWGAILAFLSLFAGIFVLNKGMEYGWTSAIISGSIIACIICIFLFLLNEKRHPQPMIRLSMMKDRNFFCANVAGAVILLVFTGATFLFPFYLEILKGMSVSVAGTILVIPSVAMIIGGPIAGALSDRGSSRMVCIMSAIIGIFAFFMFATLNTNSSLIFLATGLALMGFSAGMFVPASSNLIFSITSQSETGIVSGIMLTVRDAGAAIGIAVFGSVFATVVYSNLSPEQAGMVTASSIPGEILVNGFQAAFIVGAAFSAVAILISIVIKEPGGEEPVN